MLKNYQLYLTDTDISVHLYIIPYRTTVHINRSLICDQFDVIGSHYNTFITIKCVITFILIIVSSGGFHHFNTIANLLATVLYIFILVIQPPDETQEVEKDCRLLTSCNGLLYGTVKMGCL